MRRSELLAAAGLAHGFGDRAGGVSRGIYATANAGFNGDDEVAVRANRARFAQRLGADPARLATARQVHGRTVRTLAAAEQNARAADALVSRTPGLVLAVTTADCVPLLLADPAAGVAAAVHAGWRGAVAGVVEAAVTAMVACGARPARLVAAVGPAIRQPSYEVDAPVRDAVLEATPGAERFFAAGRRAERWQFDLPGYCCARLAAAGAKKVDDLGVDTLDRSDIYFSHRRSKQRNEVGYGVQLSGIVVPG